jgi:hypothetical protein
MSIVLELAATLSLTANLISTHRRANGLARPAVGPQAH